MNNTAPIMQIPNSIDSYIKQHQLECHPVSALSQPIWAVPILFMAGDKPLLVITASNLLIDRNQIQMLAGAPIRPAPKSKVDALLAKHQLSQLPALPELLGIPTLVERKLVEMPNLVIRTDNDEFYDIGSTKFFNNQANVKIESFSKNLANTHQDHAVSLFDIDVDHIEEAIQRFTVLRIRQRLEETLDLPPMPETARAIIRLRTDPNADVQKLAKIVETDPSLAAQVVSWASASYYSAPGSVKSVQDAIVRVLGFELVMNLSLGLALGKSLDLPNNGPEGATPFWNEAVYIAAAVSGIVGLIAPEFRPSYGLAYLSGLLHNFGYLVLAHSFRPHFDTIARLIEANPHLEYNKAEEAILGINREQIAANLIKAWGLPDEVCYGVRYQSQCEYPGVHADYAHLLFLATQLLRRNGVLSGPIVPIPDAVWQGLQLKPDDVLPVMEKMSESMNELNSLAKNMAE